MSRLALASALCGWLGATLLLSCLRVVARPRLVERLRPYGTASNLQRGGRALSADSFRDVVGPLAQWLGGTLSRGLGISEDLSVRLRRIRSPHDVASFRVAQAARAAVAVIAITALGLATGFGSFTIVSAALAAGLLAFLVLEQRVIAASNARKRRLFTELPVVTEQLGMLLGAGFSLGSALSRLASRGSGVCAEDLRAVTNRIRQGLGEAEALREWADLADVPELHRLVGVLALNREAGDLGRLIGEEARSMRREAQRRLIEVIGRRGQMVWIPVTVATLVPGVMLMAVPFVDALHDFSAL
ncbi:MAG: type II secretion system F family protein [Acidimicrobiia bacterium]|nr:type II secretion system F family protein [Acidimicrobiia bacterium]